MRIGTACRHLAELEASLRALGDRDLADSAARLIGLLKPYARAQTSVEDLAGAALARIGPAALAPAQSMLSAKGRPLFNLLVISRTEPGWVLIRDILSERAEAASSSDAAETCISLYVSALKDAIHDSALFPEIIDRLQADKRIGRDAMVRIASLVAYPLAKSTTRKDALARIQRLHDASEAFAAKANAMKGKSAA